MATPKSVVIVSGAPQGAVINTPFPQPVTVRVTDVNNAIMVSEPVIWSVSQVPTDPRGSFASTGFSPYTSLTDANGIASSGVITANQYPGNWAGLAQCVNALSVNVTWYLGNATNDPASLAWVSGQDQKIAINAAAAVFKVKVTNTVGTPLNGIAVRFEGYPGTGLFANSSTICDIFTNSAGEASSYVWTASGTPSQSNMGVSLPSWGSVAPLSTTIISVNPAIPVRMDAVQGMGWNANVGAAFPGQLIARLFNGLGVPQGMTGLAVRFAAPQSGAACTFGGNWWYDTTADVNGGLVATTPFANATAGTYNVICTVNAYPNISCGFQLTNGTPAVAARTPPFIFEC